MNTRVARVIKNESEIEALINLKWEDITSTYMMELFGEFAGKRKYNPYDIITIPVGVYGNGNIKNKNEFTTTVGRFIFNKYFVEADPGIFGLLHYVNEDINGKILNGHINNICYKIMENKIDLDEYKIFMKKTQKFMPYVSILSPNHSMAMLNFTTKVNTEKAKYKKELDKAILENDIKTIDDISNALLEFSRKELADDPAMDMFNSGAGGSFDNNFKNMFIMRGSVKNPDPTKGYNIILSNYLDGISKEEYSAIANTLAAGPYARSKKTELGGYWEKLFMSAFQHVILLDPDTNCGTNRYITIKITKKNIDSVMYCYVIEGNKLIEITSENRNSYIGKVVKLRFSSMCEAENGICNKCAGNLFYRLGIRNIGAATPQIPSKLKLLSMKGFHDDQIRFATMDPMKAFFPDSVTA